MICARCNHEILPGQSYMHRWINRLVAIHVACPSEREVERARLWGRWT